MQLKKAMMTVLTAINPAIPDANYSAAVDDVLKFEESIANVNPVHFQCYIATAHNDDSDSVCSLQTSIG